MRPRSRATPNAARHLSDRAPSPLPPAITPFPPTPSADLPRWRRHSVASPHRLTVAYRQPCPTLTSFYGRKCPSPRQPPLLIWPPLSPATTVRVKAYLTKVVRTSTWKQTCTPRIALQSSFSPCSGHMYGNLYFRGAIVKLDGVSFRKCIKYMIVREFFEDSYK
jgi:hypothetical protein